MRQIIKDEVVKIWAKLSDSLEDEMEEFAKQLFEKGFIGKGALKKTNYNTLMGAFSSGMDLFNKEKEYKDHCRDLLDILDEMKGNVKKVGTALRKAWNAAVKDKFGCKFM